MKKSLLFGYALGIILYFLSFITGFAAISISPLKYELTVKQGENSTQTVKITNESPETITLYSSSEDFITSGETGQPQFVKPEDQESSDLSLANWIELNEKNITLAPSETKEVAFTIKVPQNGEPGGHYGAIFFSPGLQNSGKLGFSKRIGVLILINVPGNLHIEGSLEKFEVGLGNESSFVEKNDFNTLPVHFKTTFQNNGNIHLKPKGKIELIDENGEILKNIGKETMVSTTFTFIGEKLVDYIPINSVDGNVLPNSKRAFESDWEGFGYNIVNDDGTKGVKFKSIGEYYFNRESENKKYLMFWEGLHIKKVKKKITAKYQLAYESKDISPKKFEGSKDFYIEYNEQYVGLNYGLIVTIVLLLMGGGFFFIIIQPKNKRKKEENMRKKIMKEINNH